MPEESIPNKDSSQTQPGYWEAIYADLLQKMTPTAADEAVGLQAGTFAAAIKRGEITPYQFSKRKVYVTPRLIAMWAEQYHRIPQAIPLPG